MSPPTFDQRVAEKLDQLRVFREAQRQLEISALDGVSFPNGVFVGDPLPPEPTELIDGVLLTHGATGIIGQKETGKSLVALEIQHSLLTGEPLWGMVKPNKVVDKTVHFLAEHASRLLIELYNRTKMRKDVQLKIYGPEHLGAMKLLVSNGNRREEAVSFYKRLAEGAGLVVFDPLAAFIQGQSAENDNSPMRNLVDSMTEIATSTGASCLILGHQGKPLIFQGREIKRGAYATRGASATEDAMAAVHYLSKIPNTQVAGNTVFELRPVFYKGRRQPAYQLIRDHDTCRHTINRMFKIKNYGNDDLEE